MKHVKLLLSMSLLILSGNLRAQAIFANKSKFMTMSDAPAFTQVNFLHYISEKVNLDSLKNDTAFYTVKFFESDSNYSDQYHLKCYSNKVYFSGKIIDYYPYKAFNVKEVLIYDFNLKAGDTINISENESKKNEVINGIQNVFFKSPFLDAKFLNVYPKAKTIAIISTKKATYIIGVIIPPSSSDEKAIVAQKTTASKLATITNILVNLFKFITKVIRNYFLFL